MEAMGLFHVPARLTGPTGRSEIVEVLVDTGATFLVVPRALAERLELRPTRACPIETAGGRQEIWPLAEVRIRLDGDEVTTPCLDCGEPVAVEMRDGRLTRVDPPSVVGHLNYGFGASRGKPAFL